jgi:hypothetical protein
MKRSRNLPPSSPRPTSQPPALALPPRRAFVLHLDARAQPPRHWARAHLTSLRALVTFLANVLHNRAASDWKAKSPALEEWESATLAISRTASRNSRVRRESSHE